MSRHYFPIALSSVALAALLGSVALAQDATPDSPEAEAPAAAASDLPEMLSGLNLSDVEVRDGRRGGRRIEGDLPGGGEIEAMIGPDGNVMMVEADDAAVPQSLIDAMIPQALRDGDTLSQFAVIDRIGSFEGRIMVGGEDADGEDLRAGFDADGRLMRFGRGDDDRDMRERAGRERAGRDDDRRDSRRDMRGEKAHDWRAPELGHMMAPERGAGPRPGDMPRVDIAELTETLIGAGYSGISSPRPAGPRLAIDATNPAGEPVTLEVDPAGEVLREIAR